MFPVTLLKINACVFRKSLWKEKVLLLVDVVTSQEKLFSRGLFCVEINLNIFSSWFEPNNRKCSRFRPISIMLCKLVQEGQKTFSFYLDDTQSCCWIKKLHPFWKDKQKLLVASFWKRICYHLPFFFMQKKVQVTGLGIAFDVSNFNWNPLIQIIQSCTNKSINSKRKATAKMVIKMK